MSGAEAILGVVAGGAGLLSLSIQLGESVIKLRRMYVSAKDAPKTIARVLFDLETLVIALREIEQQRQHNGNVGSLLLRCVRQCQEGVADVQELVDKIEARVSRHNRIGAKVYSMFKETELTSLLGQLDSAISHLQLAYMIHLHDEQRRMSEDNKKALDLRSSMLHNINRQMESSRHQSLITSREVAEASRPLLETMADIADETTKGMGGLRSRNDLGDHRTLIAKFNHAETSKSQRRSLEKVFQIRFRLRRLICSWVWDLALTRSQSCYSMHLRTYNMVSVDSAIAYYREKGNLQKTRELFRDGKASPLDIVVHKYGLESTLLQNYADIS
ncbi:hypothetical protein HJFPF1_10475 [Paramyrothecium foliicola]|nr:hypothetical protein HJFPF1_10475 [Paramyrothecium foliicola]